MVHGHLLVGGELVEAGHHADALAHFLHPIEEIYADIAAQLVMIEAEPFADELTQLAIMVKDEETGEEFQSLYDETLATVMAQMQRAAEAGGDAQTVTRDAISALVQTAAEEYDAAVEDGRFVGVAEYQDARGFVMTAEAMAEQLTGAATAVLGEHFAALKEAFPSVEAPDEPVMEPGALQATVSRIQLALSGM